MFDLVFVTKSKRTMGVLRFHGGMGMSLFTAIGVLFVFSKEYEGAILKLNGEIAPRLLLNRAEG